MPKRYGNNRRRKQNRRRFHKSRYLKGGSGEIKALKTLTFPDKIVSKLPWLTYMVDSTPAGVGTNTNHVYRINSIRDPDWQLGINQISASGFAQWSKFYNRYRVLGAKLILDVANTQTYPVKVSLCFHNDANTNYDRIQTGLNPHMVETVLSAQGSGTSNKRLVKYVACNRITGVSMATYKGDDRYQSLFSSDPQEIITAKVFSCPLLGNFPADQAQVINYSLKIIYYVEMFDRINDIPLSEVVDPEVPPLTEEVQ